VIVVVDGSEGAVRLEQPEALNELSVKLRDCSVPHAGTLLSGLGRIDGTHVWLDINGLKQLSPLQLSPEWASGFDATIDYARTKGWTDVSGHVRAHLV
jgi:hypothetical protein